MDTGPAHFTASVDTTDAISFSGSIARFLAPSDRTAGQVSLSVWTVAPGDGSQLHVHDHEDEAFYIIAGEQQGVCGEDEWHAGPGTLVWLPHGIPHGFRSVGREPLQMLVLFTGGQQFEALARRVGVRLASDLTPLASSGPDHGDESGGLTVLGPLPGPKHG